MPVRDVRRRYLYAVVESEERFTEPRFSSTLEDKIHFLYGVTGATAMNMRVIEWDDERQAAIVRVNHLKLNEMRAALAHMSELNGAEVRVNVRRVSGTIKTLKSKI
jgi:RNase P/RNase MRP subunit POP5